MVAFIPFVRNVGSAPAQVGPYSLAKKEIVDKVDKKKWLTIIGPGGFGGPSIENSKDLHKAASHQTGGILFIRFFYLPPDIKKPLEKHLPEISLKDSFIIGFSTHLKKVKQDGVASWVAGFNAADVKADKEVVAELLGEFSREASKVMFLNLFWEDGSPILGEGFAPYILKILRSMRA